MGIEAFSTLPANSDSKVRALHPCAFSLAGVKILLVPEPDEEIAALESSALDLLQQIVQEAHDAPDGDGPVEIGFNYRHAHNIVSLAVELLSSIREGHVASPPIIARAMLESLFNLAASTCINQFPPGKSFGSSVITSRD